MKNSKRLLLISGISLSAVLVVVLLSLTSSEPNQSKNGFDRKIVYEVNKIGEAQCGTHLKMISGSEGNMLYCQGEKPAELFAIPNSLSSFSFKKIIIPAPKICPHYYSYVIKEKFFLYSSFPSAFILYDLQARSLNVTDTAINFMRIIPLSEYGYITRSVNGMANTPAFIKMSAGKKIADLSLPDEKDDGGFATDGVLSYDRQGGNLFYMCYYFNRFYCIDTNLRIKFTANTLDTFRTMRTIGKEITKKGHKAFTLAAPPKFINWHLSASGDKLFINSLVQADNESTKNFKNNSVIDVYNAKNGSYQYSFYIPAYNGEKLREFSVFDNRLFALYGKQRSTVISFAIPIVNY